MDVYRWSTTCGTYVGMLMMLENNVDIRMDIICDAQ